MAVWLYEPAVPDPALEVLPSSVDRGRICVSSSLPLALISVYGRGKGGAGAVRTWSGCKSLWWCAAMLAFEGALMRFLGGVMQWEGTGGRDE